MNLSWIKPFIILIFSAISFMGCSMQYNMLYFPDLRLPSKDELLIKRLDFWPAGQLNYRGFISTGVSEPAIGTVIVFHGNAGTAADREYYLAALCPMGYRVILAEYPGYGERRGKLGEKSFINDSKETLRIVAERFKGPIFLLGESLGCGVVAGVSSDTSLNLAGIILITPWNTLLAVAKDHYPFLPVSWFMKDKYDNGENLKSFPGKIAVLAAERDEIIPIGHARELFKLLPDRKKMWMVKGAGHNDWPMAMEASQWQEVMDFIR
jgi:uncharacterized protein